MFVVGEILVNSSSGDGPQIGSIKVFQEYENALDYAVDLIMDQINYDEEKGTLDELKDSVRKEVGINKQGCGDFFDYDGGFTVFIRKTEKEVES